METSRLRAAFKPSALIPVFPDLLGSSSCSKSTAGSSGVDTEEHQVRVGKTGRNSVFKHPRRSFAKQQLHLTPEMDKFQQSSSQARGDTGWEMFLYNIQGEKSL